MNKLIDYLIEHLILDFDGELTIEKVREFLRGDESRDARALVSKLAEDRGTSDMLLALADCLKEHVTARIDPSVVREQLVTYSES